jgi:hypothetical protein
LSKAGEKEMRREGVGAFDLAAWIQRGVGDDFLRSSVQKVEGACELHFGLPSKVKQRY